MYSSWHIMMKMSFIWTQFKKNILISPSLPWKEHIISVLSKWEKNNIVCILMKFFGQNTRKKSKDL